MESNPVWRKTRLLGFFYDLFVFMGITILIYVPDRSGLAATIFGRDNFYHVDAFIMAPAWAWLKGCVLDIDVISQYGIGMPILTAIMSQWVGGFSYENVFLIFVIMTIVYFFLVYTLIKIWLHDRWLALGAVIVAIFLQMLNSGVADPVIWRYPSGSVVRYFWGLPMLIALLFHLRTGQTRFLWAAMTLSGVGLFYVPDSGVYQLLTFYFYLVSIVVLPRDRDFLLSSGKKKLAWGLGFATPVAMNFLLLFFVTGKRFFSSAFLNNSTEFIQYFSLGFGALPINTSLLGKQYMAFVGGWVVLMGYLLNLLFIGSLYFTKKIHRDHFLSVVLSIYGLSQYHYYVCRSAPVNYLTVIIPFVGIASYWLSQLKHGRYYRGFIISLVAISAIILFCHPAFRRYPNIFHPADFKKEKEYWARQLPLEKDVQLIRDFTSAQDRVCLLSSFDAAILIAADRRPFFYFYPIFQARLLGMLDFGGTYLFSRSRLQKTIDQLEAAKPEYVFMERKLFYGELPKIYYERYRSLAVLFMYLHQNYEPVQEGKFLTILKRKGMSRHPLRVLP